MFGTGREKFLERIRVRDDLPIAPALDEYGAPCWMLTTTKGRRNPDTYLSVKIEGFSTYAHRASWAYLHMDWTYVEFAALCAEHPDLRVHHLCHRRACVNPEHLALVDDRANKRDAAMSTAAVKRARKKVL